MPENPVQSLLEQPQELWLVSAPEITTSNLTKNLQNKSILDQASGEFKRQISYKLAWKGGIYLEVPAPYTS